MSLFDYTVLATEGEARAGLFNTPHGLVETPVFMPVGTNSTVKTLTWPQVADTGAQIVLSNASHMYLRPGHELVQAAGGLHGWMNWQKPILTDSGGFQVFSLSSHRSIGEDGVEFRDTHDGSLHFISPEKSMEIQNALGADVIMAFDECPPYPATREYVEKSLGVTHRWLERCFNAHARANDQALFPIVQGSTFRDLREQSVAFATQFPAVGFAIGGVSVGETKLQMEEVVSYTAPMLPPDKPRYLMGVGTPEDLLSGIRHGIDMFDCVMPTRNARHGSFFTPDGRKIIKNLEFRDRFGPLVEGCGCYTCQNHHAAYARHLFRASEQTAGTLLSIHNIYTLVNFAQRARAAILAGTFEDFFAASMERLGHAPSPAKG